MKVVLIKDVEKLGKRGDVKEVAQGFARNFLFTARLAVLATAQAIKEAQRVKQQTEKQRQQKKTSLRSLIGILAGCTVELSAKASPTGQLYGGINAKQVSDALQRQNITVEPKRILMSHIKTLGTHTLAIDCGEGKTAHINLVITPAN